MSNNSTGILITITCVLAAYLNFDEYFRLSGSIPCLAIAVANVICVPIMLVTIYKTKDIS